LAAQNIASSWLQQTHYTAVAFSQSLIEAGTLVTWPQRLPSVPDK
jgi:hypothetical protein